MLSLYSSLAFLCFIGICLGSSSLIQQLNFDPKGADLYGGKGCGTTCCSGKNNTCFTIGVRMGGKSSPHDRCFCDAGCLDMEDCCQDYSVACQAIDCEVSEWEEYGACSSPCGTGIKARNRKVLTHPRNGGRECPLLQEKTVCSGTRCKSTRHLGGLGGKRVERETARIMPAKFGKFRELARYNPEKDIRKNLFYQFYRKAQTSSRDGYCSKFRVTSSRKGCTGANSPAWASSLRKGAIVCVECQKTAMKNGLSRCGGHGREDMNTYWNAVNAPGCHGWWMRIEEHTDCTCAGGRGKDFIYV